LTQKHDQINEDQIESKEPLCRLQSEGRNGDDSGREDGGPNSGTAGRGRANEYPKSVPADGNFAKGYYYECNPETEENLATMSRVDELHLKYPMYGSRKLGKLLEREGWVVKRKRVMRMLQVMGIEAIYQKPKTSEPSKWHQIYLHLLKDHDISAPD